MLKKLTQYLALVLLLVISSGALCCWIAVEPEVLAQRCPVIIAGKIVRVGGEHQEIAYIKADKIYKNILSDYSLKVGDELPARMSPKNRTDSAGNLIMVSTDINYKPGKDGIWLITLHEDRVFSIEDHPYQLQDRSKESELKKKKVFRARDKKTGLKSFTTAEWIEEQKDANRRK